MNLQEFKQKVLPLKDKLFRFAIRIVSDHMEAEDIVQEVFIKIWKKRDDLKGIENFEAWCIRVTKNLAIDKLRTSHNKHTTELPDGMDWKAKDTSPHKATELQDVMDRVKNLISQLPNSQKMVIQLRDIEGLTYKEIAAALDITMEQVKVYLYRARKHVRQQLIKSESYGIENH